MAYGRYVTGLALLCLVWIIGVKLAIWTLHHF
jgi:hypothetical protein